MILPNLRDDEAYVRHTLDRVIRDYMDVDEDVVRKTSAEEIPRPVAALEPLVRG